jgi:general secretion pathway protein N
MTSARLLAIGSLLAALPLATANAADVAANDTPASLDNPVAAQTLDRLSATREHPLFSPTRRPPPPPPIARVEAPPPPPPPPPPNVVLIGVVMDSEETRAVVRATDRILRLQIGDDVGGWKVAQIDSRKLVLSLDERFATFMLFSSERNGEDPSTRAAAAPVAPAPPPQQSQPTPPPSRRSRNR